MSGAKDYQNAFERVMAQVETKDELRQERRGKEFFKTLEEDRKRVGMRPKEMFEIFERDGLEALLDEIKRRLTTSKKRATQL
jgi:hypothetical protein